MNKKILSLDVSTSVIGWCLTRRAEDGTVSTKFGALDFRNKNKFETLFQKLESFKEFISSENDIDRIIIEEPNKGFKDGGSSPQVLALLQKFNGMVSAIVWDYTKKEPEYIMATSARKKAGVEIEKGADKKKKTFEWLLENHSQFKQSVTYTTYGNPKPIFYDMSDAIVLMLGALKDEEKRCSENGKEKPSRKNTSGILDTPGKKNRRQKK